MASQLQITDRPPQPSLRRASARGELFHPASQCRQLAILLFLFLLASPEVLFGQPYRPGVNDDQSLLQNELQELREQTIALMKSKQIEQAIPLQERILEIQEQLNGKDSREVFVALTWLKSWEEQLGRIEQTILRQKQIVDVQRQRFGEAHFEVATAKIELQILELFAQQTPENCLVLIKARHELGYANWLNKGGMYRQSLEVQLGIHQKVNAILGDENLLSIEAMGNLANSYYFLGEFNKALLIYRSLVDSRAQTHGRNHPDYGTALGGLASVYIDLADLETAEKLLREQLTILANAYGTDSPKLANVTNNLAYVFRKTAKYAEAEVLWRQSLKYREQIHGVGSEESVPVLTNLGKLLGDQGKYTQAESYLREAIEIGEQHFGKNHPRVASAGVALGALLVDQGELAEADTLFKSARRSLRASVGENHVNYSSVISHLAGFYHKQGDRLREEPLLREAIDLSRRSVGDRHPHYATMLTNLGKFYLAYDQPADAIDVLESALEIRRDTLPDNHPDIAESLKALAVAYARSNRNQEADANYLAALDIFTEAFGEQHLKYATALADYAEFLRPQDQQKAIKFSEKALASIEAAKLENSPEEGAIRSNLGLLYADLHRWEDAEREFKKCLTQTEAMLANAAKFQSERQQFRMHEKERGTLGGYLSVAQRAGVSADEMYRHILRWKGSVFRRQLGMRMMRSQPQAAKQIGEIEKISQSISQRWSDSPSPEQRSQWRLQIDQRSRRKELLEQELARHASEVEVPFDLDVDSLRASLPANTVLVDIQEYLRLGEDGDATENATTAIGAFVLSSHQPTVFVELDKFETLLRHFSDWAPWTGAPNTKAGREVRRRIWDPLHEHLSGAEYVLVSPDGLISEMPLGALPGTEPNTYLIEECKIALVPVPSLIPQLLTNSRSVQKPGGLLLVGGIDYDQPRQENDSLESEQEVSQSRMYFGALPGTREESQAIAQIYKKRFPNRKLTELAEQHGTEDRFRDLVSGHRWLHLATHGYFMPSQRQHNFRRPGTATNVSDIHPGLMAGLAFAGANQPAGQGRDDGVLMGLEVAALDLRNVDMAVLSACETGLGKHVQGEGLLGLQRAFQIAGTQTVVASLWSVHDQATRLLMERFYDNLWNKQMGRLDALWEAQIWMLKGLELDKARDRGLEPILDEKPVLDDGRLPPYYWAAFVMSGDWR